MSLRIYSAFVSPCFVRDVQIVSLHAAQGRCWCWCWCWGGVSQRGSADQTVGVSLWCVRMELTPFCLTLCEYKLWHFFTFTCCWQIFLVSELKITASFAYFLFLMHCLFSSLHSFWILASRAVFFLFVSSFIFSFLIWLSLHVVYFFLPPYVHLPFDLLFVTLVFAAFCLRTSPPPSTSLQFVSRWTPTSLSSTGTTTSFWPARITGTPPAGLWGGKRLRVVSEPAPPAGAPCPPAPAPAARSATSTQPTAGCTGVSLQTGRPAMPSTSPSLVLQTTHETSAD